MCEHSTRHIYIYVLRYLLRRIYARCGICARSCATSARSVSENVASGTTLASLGALDQDMGSVLTYVANYPPEALGIFIVDSTNGTIVIIGAVDYERRTSYTLQVRVCGGC